MLSNSFKLQAFNYIEKVNVNDFVHSTFCSLNKRYFYASTPKSGCSTIKKILVQAELEKRIDFGSIENIHNREFTPFLKINQVGNLEPFFERPDIFKFCFVRNPYTRLLSCYLDKIKKNQYPTYQLKIQSGLHPNSPKIFTFGEFVDLIIEQPEMFMDEHWRTQYYQTYQTKIEYNHIGKFENFENDLFIVLEQLNIDPDKFYSVEKSHATNADKIIQDYYTQEIANKVYQRFRVDFDYFGYSSSI